MSITDRATPALQHVPRASPALPHPLNVDAFTLGLLLLPAAPILVPLILLSEEYSLLGSGAAEQLPHQPVWPQHSQISISTPASLQTALPLTFRFSQWKHNPGGARNSALSPSHMQSSSSSGPLATATVTLRFWRPANLGAPFPSKITEDPRLKSIGI